MAINANSVENSTEMDQRQSETRLLKVRDVRQRNVLMPPVLISTSLSE